MASTALTVDVLKANLATQHMKTLDNFFKNDKEKTLKFLSAVAYCAQSTPGLLECTQDSIISSFMKCAEYDLYPSSVSWEVYILPYQKGNIKVAQFQLGYKGIIALLKRSGINVYTDIVKANDTCKITSGFDQNIIHEYPLTDRGEAIGVYAIAKVDGEKTIKYMSKPEVLEFKKFSKAWNSEYSPWNPKNDPELNMWRKTAIKQIAKNLPLTEKAHEAIALDNEEASIDDYHKNALVEQARRESTSLNTILTPSLWTTPSTETSSNEPTNGSKQEPEKSQAQDSKKSSEKSEQNESKPIDQDKSENPSVELSSENVS